MTDGHRTSSIPRPQRAGTAGARGGAATRSRRGGGTATADRTGQLRRAERDRLAGTAGTERPGLLDDLTSAIPMEKRIVRKSRGRLAITTVGLLIALAIGAALFVLPVKSWMRQRDDLRTRTAELETLEAANAQLQAEVSRLMTDEGIAEAIRTEIDYVPSGEKRITVLPTPAASTALPAGWPYDLISSIIAIRQAEAAAELAGDTATTLAP